MGLKGGALGPGPGLRALKRSCQTQIVLCTTFGGLQEFSIFHAVAEWLLITKIILDQY